MRKIFVSICLLCILVPVFSAHPWWFYTGLTKVTGLTIRNDIVFVEIDNTKNIETLGCTHPKLVIDPHSDFKKEIFTALLSAQNSGKKVSILVQNREHDGCQMWNGATYVKIQYVQIKPEW